MTDTKLNPFASIFGGVARAAARELLTSAGREIVERVARSAYEAEHSEPPWAEIPEDARAVWRRRVGNVLRAGVFEMGKINQEKTP